MPKYRVNMCRIGYGFNSFTVIADTEEKAREMALDRAGDCYYSEKTSEYEIEDIYPEED